MISIIFRAVSIKVSYKLCRMQKYNKTSLILVMLYMLYVRLLNIFDLKWYFNNNIIKYNIIKNMISTFFII